jgi:hypothetical protein
MTKTPQYNAAEPQVHAPKVDAQYVASLRERIRSARRAFQETSSRLEVLTEAQKQARAR